MNDYEQLQQFVKLQNVVESSTSLELLDTLLVVVNFTASHGCGIRSYSTADMSHDEFTKLFTYVTEQFGILSEKLDSKADNVRVELILKHLDEIRGLLDTDEVERSAIVADMHRHSEWIQQASTRVGVRFDAS